MSRTHFTGIRLFVFFAICTTETDLELHHLASITLLLENWARSKSYDISTDDGILSVRDEFIESHRAEIYDDVYTLCNKHHVALHSVFGKAPALNSADRQRTWIEIQKQKAMSKTDETPVAQYHTGVFSRFVEHYNFKDFY